ncbi:hypothetical protein J6590_077277 [Homalodisca vitripennis]|nr:hypothetical protein J6590_077277 [Homalodisca vitripennis]
MYTLTCSPWYTYGLSASKAFYSRDKGVKYINHHLPCDSIHVVVYTRLTADCKLEDKVGLLCFKDLRDPVTVHSILVDSLRLYIPPGYAF